MKFKERTPKITFIANQEGLTLDTSIHPKPAREFIPSWWKKMPSKIERLDTVSKFRNGKTIRLCPSFAHWFSKGYVLPAWADITLKYDEENEIWSWTCGGVDSIYKIEIHGLEQFLSHVTEQYQGEKGSFVFKLISPWNIITSRGWSVMQLPMWFHFNHEWSVMPGILDTDIHHGINQQIVYYGKGKEIFIPKGTPLVHYVPFKRKEAKMGIREMTARDKLRFAGNILMFTSKNTGGYNSMKRD
jgi:hypothetical protein